MEILFISDTHNRLYEADVDNVLNYCQSRGIRLEAIISLGDVADFEYKILFKNSLLRSLPRYGVLGNHDWTTVLKLNSIEDIHNKVITLPNGMTMAGMCGSCKYKPGNPPCMWSQRESVEIARGLGEADILISHDTVCQTNHPINDDISAPQEGLLGINKYLSDNSICKLHIHGHLHTPYVHREDTFTRICVKNLAIISISSDRTAEILYATEQYDEV